MDTPVKVPPNGYGAWWAVPIVLAAGICAIASTRKILIIWALFLGSTYANTLTNTSSITLTHFTTTTNNTPNQP